MPDVTAELSRAMWLPDLRNPRMIHRVCERVRLLALANGLRPVLGMETDDRVCGVHTLRAVVFWIIITERWAQLRQILQDLHPSPDAWLDCINAIRYEYGFVNSFYPDLARDRREEMIGEYANVLARLPRRDRHRDLGEFLGVLDAGGRELVGQLMAVDAAMNELGL